MDNDRTSFTGICEGIGLHIKDMVETLTSAFDEVVNLESLCKLNMGVSAKQLKDTPKDDDAKNLYRLSSICWSRSRVLKTQLAKAIEDLTKKER